MTEQIKKLVSSTFKMHGLTLRSEASRCLVDMLIPLSNEVRDEWIGRMVEAVLKQSLTSSTVEQNHIQTAAQDCFHLEADSSDITLSVISAFEVPRFTYNQERKKFISNNMLRVPPPKLYPDAKAKAELFKDRYTLIQQRTARHDLFTPPPIGSLPSDQGNRFTLRPVEWLLGTNVQVGDVIVLGMITQIKEGKFHLEDPTGVVELNLSKTKYQPGLFTENCFVLAEGWYEDNLFHVTGMGFPPPEPSKASRAYYGNINFFGGPSNVSVKSSAKLRALEEQDQNAMFVFVSDVWLDQIKVMNKLSKMLAGFADFPPTAFVFCGEFTSTPYGTHHARNVREHMKQLAELISEFPLIMQKTTFIFVPGLRDPGLGTLLPRPPIPYWVAEPLEKTIPHVVFATNPCRIQYCSQEIVVFREDIVSKMCRNCFHFPDTGDIPTNFVKTLVSQAHLSPLPLHVAPVYWSYDNALWIYPLPDLVVCADKHDAYTVTQNDCTFINPGSFPRKDFIFKAYYPATRSVEDSQIPNE